MRDDPEDLADIREAIELPLEDDAEDVEERDMGGTERDDGYFRGF